MSIPRKVPQYEVDVKLARFAALRKEIDNRSNAQLALITLNITAIGGIGAYALSDPMQLNVLVLLPILCSSIGMLWLDHDTTIRKLGLECQRLELGEMRIGESEDRVREDERNLFLRIPLLLQVFILFGGSSIYALTRLANHPNFNNLGRDPWPECQYVIGLILTVMFSLYWAAKLPFLSRMASKTNVVDELAMAPAPPTPMSLMPQGADGSEAK